MRRLLLLLAATTLTASGLGGCTWRTHTSDEPDDEEGWWDSGYCDCDSDNKGDLGDSCDVDCDCNDGLTCDDVAGVCVPPTFTTCSVHSDCLPGSYCDAGECLSGAVCIDDSMCTEDSACLVEQLVCVPVPVPPACAELLDEAACSERADCEAKYVGVNCGCGSGCECSSGEEGCVCESFEFDGCVDLVE